MDKRTIARLYISAVSDERRQRALESTADLLKKIDVASIEQLRRHLELPPEVLGWLVELYVAELDNPYAYRAVLPVNTHSMSTGVIVDKELVAGVVPPNLVVSIKAATKSPFRPERLFVSAAGTAMGAADWNIVDVKVDGKSQFLQEGEIPGDMFASGAIDGFVRFEECREHVELFVRYIGANPEGIPFFASLVGDTNLDRSPVAA